MEMFEMFEEKKIVKVGEEGDYEVFYDEISGDVWFSEKME